MKTLYLMQTLLICILTTVAVPTNEKRFAAATPTLEERADPPPQAEGSVLAIPGELPSFTPTVKTESAVLSYKFQWQIYKSCPDDQRKRVIEAWADSKELSDALASYRLKGDFQPAMDMYMGDRSTYDNYFRDPPWDFPLQIRNTINRHQGLYEGKSATGNAALWVYCNEDSFWFGHCTKGDNPPRAIIAYESEDRFFNNWYITFCPQFYNSSWSIPWRDQKKNLEDNNPDPMEMETYDGPPATQGGTFFHETMHMSQLVTSPQAVDKAYGPKDCYDLARNSNTDSAVYNADSWTMVAEAIWAQQKFSLKDPPKPAEYLTPASKARAGSSDSDDIIYINAGGVIPQGAKPIKKGESFFVDTNLWEIQDPAGGPPPATPMSDPKECKNGKYDDFDKCSAECYQGQCQENAGQPGVGCTCPGSPPNDSAPPAFAPGTCCFHLTETETCGTDYSKNLFGHVKLVDDKKAVIGETKDDLGKPMNDGAPYRFGSKLKNELVITGEHNNDYVQFTIGGLSWQSKSPNGGASCDVGGWDPREGPVCLGEIGQSAKNNMDCCFPCDKDT